MRSSNYKVLYVIFRMLLLAVLVLYALDDGTAYAQESYSNKKLLQMTGANNLIGVWEAQETTKGGLGAIYEFREDGGWVGTLGALVDGKDTIPNPFIKHFAEHPESENTEQLQKVMDGPEGSPAFVGAWKYRHYTGGFAYERILPDGRHMLRVPFPFPWGKYEVKGKTLRLIAPDCPAVVASYRIVKGTTLELIFKDKKTLKLKRVQPTWYHAPTESEVEEAKTIILKKQQELENKQRDEGVKSFEILR